MSDGHLARDLRHRLGRHLAVVPGMRPAADEPAAWSPAEMNGRVVELTGRGRLSFACRLVRAAQREGETTAWLGLPDDLFYPPDAARTGVDLTSLVVVRCPDARAMAGAADKLARSGAFGLLVLDFPAGSELPAAGLSRLAGLATRHEMAIVCLSDKREDAPSMGSLVSLRGAVSLERVAPGRFACRVAVLKDKRRGPGRRDEVACDGPPGLR